MALYSNFFNSAYDSKGNINNKRWILKFVRKTNEFCYKRRNTN